MKYDFDKVVDRTGTDCLKFDFAVERGVPEDVLPLWVADMDFQVPPAITDRLRELADHGIFGYTEAKADYYQIVSRWFEKHFNWKIENDWVIKTPGVVFALAMAVQAFTREGDGVLIQQPVYYPFSEVITDNGRRLVNAPLHYEDGAYTIDFAAFEETITRENVRLFLLCNPHNPVGRVWTRDELTAMEEICLKHDVTVISDEIHCDFVWPGHRHEILVDLDERYRSNVITCTAPSKSFNIAGMQISNIVIPDEQLRKRFKKAVSAAGYSQVNGVGLECCKAAYTGGEEWLAQVKEYIWENILFTKQYVETNMPGVTMVMPEGTYLIWLDFRSFGMSEEQRQEKILKEAKLWLDSGAIFGPDGDGFERINTACPRSVLEEALRRLAEAFCR